MLALQRHPVAVAARFRHALVLTYALPAPVLEPLLAPGLELERLGPWGFLATALVQTERLRPAFLPASFGRPFFLVGHRVFARHRTAAGVVRRGMRILRSDTDRPLMKAVGNLLTHYRYRVARVRCVADAERLEMEVRTPRGEADLHVVAELARAPAPLPPGSPFADAVQARRYAGPLPWTFDYEPGTRSLIQIKGTRTTWEPHPVAVRVLDHGLLRRPPFAGVPAVLAQAFHVSGLDYRWERGIRTPATGAA
jgi:hypothetical protein